MSARTALLHRGAPLLSRSAVSANDVPEIGYGMTAGFAEATRVELDHRVAEMNARF